jgi:hypothetical protein
MNNIIHCLLFVDSFASTKDELHDFAPDKEPLLSMLEGDVQPMYMCKPGKGLSSLFFLLTHTHTHTHTYTHTVFSPAYLRDIGPISLQCSVFFDVGLGVGPKPLMWTQTMPFQYAFNLVWGEH